MPTVSGAPAQPPESVALLAQRTRVGLWLSLTSITLFALVDPFVNRHVLAQLYAIKALQIAVAIALFWLLRRAATWRVTVAAALLAVTVFSVTTALSGIITNDAATTPVLLAVMSMGTSTLLPWGVGPQMAVQVVVVGSILWNFWAVHGMRVQSSLPLALAIASCVSVYAAYAAVRSQRERQRAEVAEEELRARQHQVDLAHAARLSTLGGMAAGLAHEINQPLSAIVSYASGSARRIRGGDVDPAALLEVVESIADEAVRAGEILRRIREFVHNAEAARARADLNALVREALHFAEVEAHELGVTLRLALAEETLDVEVDAIQLEQVILNLVRNGFEAMDESDGAPRELSIETSARAGGGVELIVRDTGSGLAPGSANRLFEPFFTTKQDGLGLGLPISRSIVEMYGGQLWASPNTPRGVAFHVVLPAARGTRHAA
jgi:C4-dicarboxylate-specific signal transduction histidine kinase